MGSSSKEYGNLPAQEQEFSAYFVSLLPFLGGLGGSPVAPGGRLGSPRERAQRFGAVSVAMHCGKQRSVSPTAIGSKAKLTFTSWTNSSIPLLCPMESFRPLPCSIQMESLGERKRQKWGKKTLDPTSNIAVLMASLLFSPCPTLVCLYKWNLK